MTAAPHSPGGSVERFTPAHPCPVCGGHERLPRGKGIRCAGFLSSDGRFAHCSREEHASGLDAEQSGTFAHVLRGPCRCGVTHGEREPGNGADRSGGFHIAATYDYRDESGALLFQIVRLQPKDFRQRRPDGAGGWEWSVKGVRRVLYRLPELLTALAAGDTVYIVEGEKDADRLHAEGYVATCNPCGAGKWVPEDSEVFRGSLSEVRIVADRDGPTTTPPFEGYLHAAKVRTSLGGVGVKVRVFEPPVGKDASDLIGAGRTLEDLVEIDPEVRLRELRGGDGAAFADERDGQGEKRPPLDLAAVGFTGDRLRAIRLRSPSVSPIPDIFDEEPHLHLLFGRQKSGKTTWALAIARAWALAAPPWRGTPALPGSRVLVLSREQPVTRLDAVLRRLQEHAGDGLEGWEDRIVLLGRDRELSKVGRSLLTLHTPSVAELRAALLAAREMGDPFGLVVLDSLSRLLPPGLNENDNAEISAWLDALEAIAVEVGVWVLLVHHVGYTDAPGRGEARSAGRGASAIGACAQVTLLLERVQGEANRRRLAVDGNAVLPRELHFDTAPEEAEPGTVLFFHQADLLADYDLDTLLPIGEPVSLSELAWRVSGKTRTPGKKPPGSAQRDARLLVQRFEQVGGTERFKGERGAEMVVRRRTAESES